MSAEVPGRTEPSGFYTSREKEYVELHDQVQTSISLLDSLESFLSTFQTDLTAVAGQISDLQDRSQEIDSKLKNRRRIERPLASLLSEVTIPPSLAKLILDTPVGEAWIDAVEDFEKRLVLSKSRSRVKAARDLGEVSEGLRIVAATKLRTFFLALFQPIRASVTTNMQVLQTSVLLKYSPLYAFLHRQAHDVALEVQRSYIGAARLYYETGFRRYSRSLGYVKARAFEKFENIVVSNNERDFKLDSSRLAHCSIDGPAVTLAYMADDKTYKESVEAIFRSLFLVFMDNSTAEYTFLSAFFNVSPLVGDAKQPLLSPTGFRSPDASEMRSSSASEVGGRVVSGGSATFSDLATLRSSKEEQAGHDALWKQIFDPVLEYCKTFVHSVLEPIPPVIPLLTMIRLSEDVVTEVQKRRCPPGEQFIFGIIIQMWPVFREAMSQNIEALKKLAEGTSGGYFARATVTTDAMVSDVCRKYVVCFNAFVYLTANDEETMIFSNLLKLREQLASLITQHTARISDPSAKAKAQSTIYEGVLQSLNKTTHRIAHPKSQQELAFWARLKEEARRKVVSAGQESRRH
ncbi:hypothetical protein AGABI2DRAFT_202530 [Agaricus bisporus var. bisporus H97]|uniref:hypothetical protein n=1 Tax=Agaricus bisporus var. bisporus (strain H97 / ATCC MYA-4626 / FGSC 10389) TaxID=936046 RepID=UPI00029F65A0|nr:hypothetical protein AGABI2DRAFT_202530 [Agaricus bisporus var. bisporus H97]EKV48123.1 hypothetical protein AGABI2DRAFT_202530 [Agaricus bisporus var. bisporus H97]